MRIVSKKNKFPVIYFLFIGVFILLLILLLCISIGYFIERQKSLQLLKQVQMQDSIIAPYYDKEAFKKPDIKKEINKVENKIKIPILMYHYVEYVKDDGDLIRKKLDIVPSLFEAHLKELKKANYETYFVKDVPDILNGTIHYSTQSAVLTFDDGYEDFYTDVFPLLKKYHMRATIYVIYDYIGRKGFLNEEQIRMLAESDLIEIGSHTLDHIYLKTITKEYADKQIIESKKKFEDKFGIKIYTFAYPYGAFNMDNVDSVQKAGYIAAVSVIPGMMQSNDNLFYLNRVRPGIFTPSTMIRIIESMNK